MVEDKFNSDKDLESELYALIHTILNVYEKFEEGVINNNFFRRKVKNTINELLKFNIYLDDKEINLSLLLKKMNFEEHYYNAISIINKLSSLEYAHNTEERNLIDQSDHTRKLSSIVLELPGITLEITSSFITLMDALKLKGLHETELIDKLFRELKNNMKRFPGMDDLLTKIKKIYKLTLTKFESEQKGKESSEEIVDEIYQIFKEFQSKLTLNA
ncbi:MAG: hypothetical protein ACW98D_00040 [Promethearchaeota archaeon]|jgi:hypothetical protein